MRETTHGLDPHDNELLNYDVPDEALEIATGSGPETIRAMTVAMCTGLEACPF